MGKPRALGDVAKDVIEGIEEEALIAERELRRGVVENAGNQAAVEALMKVADPVANIAQAANAALSGDLGRARNFLDEAKRGRGKQ